MDFLNDLKEQAEAAAEVAEAAAKEVHAEARTKANQVQWQTAFMVFVALMKRWDAQGATRSVSRWRCRTQQWGFGCVAAGRLYRAKSEAAKERGMRLWWMRSLGAAPRHATVMVIARPMRPPSPPLLSLVCQPRRSLS